MTPLSTAIGPYGSDFWLQLLPDGWDVAPLGARYRVELGKMLNEERGEGADQRPYLANVNVRWGAFDLTELRTMEFSDQEWERYGVEHGDVLVCEGGEIGRAAVWDRPSPKVFYQKALHRLRPLSADWEEPRFIAYALSAAAGSDVFGAASSKSTIEHLTGEKLKEHRFPFPSREVQRRVADFLDAETTRIDTLIAKNKRVVGLLNEREHGVIHTALGGDIAWAPDGTPRGIMGSDIVPLGAVARVRSGITLNSSATPEDGVAVPYLRVANVQDGRIDLREVKDVVVASSQLNRWRLQAGDVLMTEGGDPDKLGRGAVWSGEVDTCLHQNHVFAIRPDPRRLRADYLALVSRSSYARVYFETTASKTTGIASTSSRKIAQFRLPIMSVAEQARLVQESASAIDLIAHARDRLADQIELLRERRQALITAAVTGQIEV